MKKKTMIIALTALLGISTGAGNVATLFAAEGGAEMQENVFVDGSSGAEAENEETDSEDEFSAGEDTENNDEIFQDGEDTTVIEDNAELAESGKANSEEDFVYKVYGADQYVEIQKYVGTSSEVIIPSTIKGYPVRVVDGLDKDVIRRLVIPDSVVTLKSRIGKNIEDVSLPDSLTTLPDSCFSGCKNLRYVKIPSKVTEIPESAFSGSGIEKIDFPENLTEIGRAAFAGCLFETFRVPDSVQTIGQYAFSECENLKEIKLPEALTVLNGMIFYGDNCLEKVNYLPNLQYIGNHVFNGTAISTITFSKTVEAIDYYAFYNCKNLKYIVCRGNILKKWPADITVFALSTELRKCPPYGDSYPIDSPINMKLVQKDNQITLSWDAVSYIAGYKVYRSDTENGNYQQVADITDNTYTETIDEDQHYYYKVCVYYNFNGDVVEGNFSTIVDNESIPLNKCRFSYNAESSIYTGSPIELDMKVNYEGKQLEKGKNYDVVEYIDNVNAGTAYVVLQGKGRFTDTCKVSFKIVPRNITEADFPQIADKPYMGSPIKPEPEIFYNTLALQKGTDYTLTYKDNIYEGTASIIFKGKRNFTGTQTLNFNIVKSNVPKLTKTTITSITVGGTDKLTVNWKKTKKAQGYELYQKSEFDSKYKKIKTIGNGNTTKYTVSGLSGGTRYTYKIRSYYVVNGRKIYSPYSSAKSRTTKRKTTYVGVHSYKVRVTAPDGGVNMRSGAGVEYYKVLSNMIPNGTILTITREAVASNGNSWGYTNYRGTYGWIALTQVTKYREGEPTEGAPIPHTRYVINCQRSITLRTRPDVNAPEIYQIPLGTAVATFDYAGNGFITVYYRGRTGYCLAYYLSDPIN